jgi:thymidylate synthase
MYGLLLEFLAKGNGLKAGSLIGQLGDCHLYSNHLTQASEQLERYMYELPTIKLKHGLYLKDDSIFMPVHNSVSLINYKSHPAIKAPLSVG